MVQWVNRLRNNIFVNLPPLPLLCEISGALHLAQLDLAAGSLTNPLQPVFWVKPIARLIFNAQNFPEAIQFPPIPTIY